MAALFAADAQGWFASAKLTRKDPGAGRATRRVMWRYRHRW